MPGSHSVERFVIEENLHCIIKTHWKERKTWWVTSLIMCQFNQVWMCTLNADSNVLTFLIFLFHLFSAAQLLSYPGKNKIPLNYHIVEVYKCLSSYMLRNKRKNKGWFQMFIFFFLFSGDLWRAFPAPHATSHRRHVHHAAYWTLQTAARIIATSRILDCLCFPTRPRELSAEPGFEVSWRHAGLFWVECPKLLQKRSTETLHRSWNSIGDRVGNMDKLHTVVFITGSSLSLYII